MIRHLEMELKSCVTTGKISSEIMKPKTWKNNGIWKFVKMLKYRLRYTWIKKSSHSPKQLLLKYLLHFFRTSRKCEHDLMDLLKLIQTYTSDPDNKKSPQTLFGQYMLWKADNNFNSVFRWSLMCTSSFILNRFYQKIEEDKPFKPFNITMNSTIGCMYVFNVKAFYTTQTFDMTLFEWVFRRSFNY